MPTDEYTPSCAFKSFQMPIRAAVKVHYGVGSLLQVHAQHMMKGHTCKTLSDLESQYHSKSASPIIMTTAWHEEYDLDTQLAM